MFKNSFLNHFIAEHYISLKKKWLEKQRNKFGGEKTSKKRKYKTNLKVTAKIRRKIYLKVNKDNVVKTHPK